MHTWKLIWDIFVILKHPILRQLSKLNYIATYTPISNISILVFLMIHLKPIYIFYNCFKLFNKFTNSHYEDFDVFMFHTYLFMTLCFECKTATEEL